MWFAIISSLIFLAITTILFTPELRKFPIYRSVAFFFLFEGAYVLINYIVTGLWRGASGFMPVVHNMGCVILGLYVLMTAYNYKNRVQQAMIAEAKNSEQPKQGPAIASSAYPKDETAENSQKENEVKTGGTKKSTSSTRKTTSTAKSKTSTGKTTTRKTGTSRTTKASTTRKTGTTTRAKSTTAKNSTTKTE